MAAPATVYTCVLSVCVLLACCDGLTDCGGREKRDIMFPIYNEPPSFYEHAHGHRHPSGHHHPHHVHNLGPIGPQVDLTPNEIPSGLMTKLNEVSTVDDFMKLVKNMPNDTYDTSIVNRFGEDIDRNAVGKKAEFARCMPESVTVPLHLNISDPSEMHFPTCTRVNRCGGCCPTTLFSCQPTSTETINFNVMVTGFEAGSVMMTYKRTEVVPVEQHISCRCGCKLKAKHCNLTQVYKKNECRCECINVDEMQKCHAESDTKLWDYNSCACLCRENRECSTGFFFNPRTCGCMEIPSTRRRASELDKRRRRGDSERPWFNPRPVVPFSHSASDKEHQDN